MGYRETTCIYCGAKITDRSTNHARKFCSDYCAQAQFRRDHGIGVMIKTPSCAYNSHVRCFERKCGSCGWNPRVEKKRKEALAYG